MIAVGDSGPRPDDYRPEVEMVLEFIQRVWNDRDLEKVEDFMIRDLILQTIGYRTVIRPEGYRRALLKMIRPFPAGQFEIRDIQTNYDVRYAGLRVAVMWKFSGRYNGSADFGPLTDADRPARASRSSCPERPDRQEVRVYDEIGLRTQIAARRGDVPFTSTNIY